MDKVDKFMKVLNKEKLKDVKTLTGIVLITIKLCKKVYKKGCDKEIIKDSISLVLEKLIENNKAPANFEEITNNLTNEEIMDLIDDLYDSYSCTSSLLNSILCKHNTNKVSEPILKSTKDDKSVEDVVEVELNSNEENEHIFNAEKLLNGVTSDV